MNSKYGFTERKEFLFYMYNQLCNEIDRNIRAIWQILTILISAFAIFALVEKKVFPLDIACSILLLLCGLCIAFIIEGNFWYNRNLVMIANIEKQFLYPEDTKNIHYYFATHRKNNAYLDVMLIQLFFVVLLAIIVLLYHFSIRVYPNIGVKGSTFSLQRAIPYILLLIICIVLFCFHNKRVRNYNSFKAKSPGLNLELKEEIIGDSDHVT